MPILYICVAERRKESLSGDINAVRIDISVEISDARQWLLRLKDALHADGHHVFFRISGAERGRDPATSTLKLLETTVFGRGKGLWPRGNLDNITPLAPDTKADLVVSLSSGASSEHRALAIFLDGCAGLGSAMPKLLEKRVPFVEMRASDGAILASGLPAIESPEVIVHALDEFYARIITLIRIGVSNLIARRQGLGIAHAPLEAGEQAHQFGFSSLGKRLLRRIKGLHRLNDHWRVGLRKRRASLPLTGDTIIEGFTWLRDDGQRYYADPILFREGGRDFLFVEELPYASRKGIISVAELDENGQPLAPPRPIIERPGHLSYPFVFRHDGAIWMTPENAAEKRLPLYWARRFPDQWEHVGDLITGMGLHDATLVDHQGAWWILANTEDDGGSSWDCLSLFRAETPIGPFARVGHLPVQIDARYARSAGPVIAVDGKLVRPVQSCLGHYGRFLRFLEIDQLGEHGFAQHERGRLLAPLGIKAAGVHTYSVSETLEAIDAFGLAEERG